MNKIRTSRVARVLFQMAALICVSAAVALSTNAVRSDGLPIPGDQNWQRLNVIQCLGYDPTVECGGEVCGESGRIDPTPIELAEAKGFFDAGRALFLDARPYADFEAGHIHGAVSLPDYEFDCRAEGFIRETPFDRTIVTYCSGEECNASVELANDLADAGFTDVRIFFGGWPVWKKAGYPADPPVSWSAEDAWSGGQSR